MPEEARPCEFVVVLGLATDPPPDTTENCTATPLTPWPCEFVTRTSGAVATACPGAAVCESPSETTMLDAGGGGGGGGVGEGPDGLDEQDATSAVSVSTDAARHARLHLCPAPVLFTARPPLTAHPEPDPVRATSAPSRIRVRMKDGANPSRVTRGTCETGDPEQGARLAALAPAVRQESGEMAELVACGGASRSRAAGTSWPPQLFGSVGITTFARDDIQRERTLAAQPEFDVVAIGGGTAGLVTAAGVAGLGARAALIERDRLGGDCLWTGCVPSKALIASARLAQSFREAGRFGLEESHPEIDGGAVMASVRDVRAQIAPHDDPERFRAMGVDVVEGSAMFVSPHEVQVGDRRITARRFVIATGTRAAVPPIPGLAETGYFTHAEAFERTKLPRSLAVIGGGAIGVELAQSFRRLGVEVTLIEMLDHLLVREEPELAERLTRLLEGEGIRVLTGRVVTRVESNGSGARLHHDSPNARAGASGSAERQGESIEADEILVAVGRRPNTEDLGLEEAGVETDRGWVTVDDRLRTSQRHIFAAGDVTGGYMFTHVADHEARTIVQNALLPVKTKIDYRVIPWCTYTEPELAHVGLTEAEARHRHGDTVSSHVYDLAGLDRAIAERAATGCVKVVVDRRGRILGGHILGANAGTMISEIALAMKHGIGIGSLSSLVHPYPTMSEGVKRVADTYRRSLLGGWRKSLLDAAIKVGRVFPA